MLAQHLATTTGPPEWALQGRMHARPTVRCLPCWGARCPCFAPLPPPPSPASLPPPLPPLLSPLSPLKSAPHSGHTGPLPKRYSCGYLNICNLSLEPPSRISLKCATQSPTFLQVSKRITTTPAHCPAHATPPADRCVRLVVVASDFEKGVYFGVDVLGRGRKDWKVD